MHHFSGTLKAFFLQILQYTVLPIQSSRCFYSFLSLGHSEIMWIIVSSLALHIRHLGSFLVPSIFDLMLLVLMHWSWALVISDSISLFKWLFHNQYHDFYVSDIFSISNDLFMESFFLPILFSFGLPSLLSLRALLLLVPLMISMLQRWGFPDYSGHSSEALLLHPLHIPLCW